MAFAALTLLGESPKKPEGFRTDGRSWHFEWLFENRTHFPYGDWKRLEFPPPPVVEQGKVPPESIARVAISDLPKSLERVCTEEKNNYHRLLWRAYHLAGNSTIGRPWKEVENVLDRQRLTESDNDEGTTRHYYLHKKNAYTTPKGLSHDLIFVFLVFDESSEDKPTVSLVRRVEATLITQINKRFADVARTNPYPAGTVAAKAFEAAVVANAAKSCPVVQKVEI